MRAKILTLAMLVFTMTAGFGLGWTTNPKNKLKIVTITMTQGGVETVMGKQCTLGDYK